MAAGGSPWGSGETADQENKSLGEEVWTSSNGEKQKENNCCNSHNIYSYVMYQPFMEKAFCVATIVFTEPSINICTDQYSMCMNIYIYVFKYFLI